MHRPIIADLIGSRSTPTPDELLIDAARGSGHFLVTGEPSCGQHELAQAIHKVSLRRGLDLVEVAQLPDDRAEQRALLDDAARSTLVLTVAADQAPIDPTFASQLFSRDYHVRVIVLAPTVDVARAKLPLDDVDKMRRVWVPPLHLRAEAIERLLDRVLIKHHAPFRAANLSPGNLAAIRTYAWPQNLVDLEKVARGMVAYHVHGNLRAAAAAMGDLSKTGLGDLFAEVGIEVKPCLLA